MDSSRPNHADRLAKQFVFAQKRGENLSLEEFCSQHASPDDLKRRIKRYEVILSDVPSERMRDPPMRYVSCEDGVLGAGAHGIVSLYNDSKVGRHVAIKRFPRSTPGEVAKKAIYEAQVTGRAHHQNVVAIYDVDENVAMIVMEYVNGESLEKWLRRKHTFTSNEIVDLIRGIASGLDAAHRAGLIHADVKPANVLIDQLGQPKLIDFGLAIAGSPLDGCALGGTPEYMSPEQAEGDVSRFDGRTDVFSLGLVFYELLIHAYSPGLKSEFGSLKKLFEDFGPSPRKATEGRVDRDLDAICMKCLKGSPDGRYESAKELVDDLDRYATGFATLARNSFLNRATKWLRRNASVACGVAFALVLMAFVAILATKNSRLEASKRLDAERLASLAEKQKTAAQSNARLQANNASLQLKIRQEAEQALRQQVLQSARMAGKRGKWEEMVELLNRASEFPQADQSAIRLMKLAPIDAMGLNEERDAIIRELDSQADLAAGLLGQLRLWQADLAELDGNYNEADRLIAEAIATELSDADEAYANAIKSKTVEDSIKWLNKAIELKRADAVEPYHYRASAKLAVDLLLSARKQESRLVCNEMMALFPSDTQFPLMLGLLDCLDGRVELAKSRLRQPNLTLDESWVTKTEATYDTLANSIDAMNAAILEDSLPLSAYLRRLQALLSLVVQSRTPVGTLGLRMPRRYKSMLISILGTFNPLGRKRALESLAETHPLGELSVLVAKHRFDAGEFEEAEKWARKASGLPFLFDSSRVATEVIELVAISRQAKVGVKQKFTRVQDFVNKVYPTPPPAIRTIAAVYATRVGEFEFADPFLRRIKENENDPGTRLFAGYGAASVGDYARALRLVDGLDPYLSISFTTAAEVKMAARKGLEEVLKQSKEGDEE